MVNTATIYPNIPRAGDDGTASVLNPAEAALLGNQAAAQNAQGE